MKVTHIANDTYKVENLEFEGKKYTDRISLSGAKLNIQSNKHKKRKALKEAFVRAIENHTKVRDENAGKTNKRAGKVSSGDRGK